MGSIRMRRFAKNSDNLLSIIKKWLRFIVSKRPLAGGLHHIRLATIFITSLFSFSYINTPTKTLFFNLFREHKEWRMCLWGITLRALILRINLVFRYTRTLLENIEHSINIVLSVQNSN
jgi:hypothetical protein